MNTLTAPTTWVEPVGRLKLPGRADRRLSELMDRNTEGQLNADERDQLEELVELSEALSLVRAQALKLLAESK